ncbi:MAG: DNA cytosine methyltransferase [Alphaproteobacteria bacterium]|nr:DNA cytosine methyltransferase [Alphaproteobacteria bacterium]
MKVVDLFCGCGGLSLGFQKAGFNIVGAFDNWDKAISVYNENFSHKAQNVDLNNMKPETLQKLSPDIIIGGPPCQDYSAAGAHDETRGRANLTLRFAELVCSIKPKYFVMENVDRILKSNTLPKAIAKFKNAGYGLTQIVLDASRCGVPQIRKRFFLIGALGESTDFLLFDLTRKISTKQMSIKDYLGDEFGIGFYYRHPRSYARRGVFSIYEPSPTIRGVNRPIPKGYKTHKGDATTDLSKIRALTTMERARVQTFPKDFKFSGSKTDVEQMIGNAVPVELAHFVGDSLFEYIKKKSDDN